MKSKFGFEKNLRRTRSYRPEQNPDMGEGNRCIRRIQHLQSRPLAWHILMSHQSLAQDAHVRRMMGWTVVLPHRKYKSKLTPSLDYPNTAKCRIIIPSLKKS